LKPIVECVPNFSEGRDADSVRAIADAAAAVPGVKILDLTSDPDHNRSVLTFVGDPGAVRDAAIALVGAALPRIDLRRHRGQHPRIGAVDVVPRTSARESSKVSPRR
jgi:glutamate formiminotransferase